ncbi:MAG: cysteine desulfurase family protein, partial [Desulfovibrionaceae bacterium]
MTPRYFDYNATTPVLPEVFEAMRPYLTDRFGNPSSPHAWGLAAHEGLETARAQVADLIHARPDEIVFTSCATESNNTVITGLLGASEGRFVTSAIEHPAVLAPARALRGYGVETALLPVGPAGVVDPADLPDLLDRRAKLVSVMLANNETGALQPV